MDSIDFGLVLNLHQPAGNLDELLDRNEWEAKEILWALDRIPRSLWEHEDVGRVHLSLSGTLLETLADPAFPGACLRDRRLRLAARGTCRTPVRSRCSAARYYHPVLPLIPAADRDEQIARWLGARPPPVLARPVSRLLAARSSGSAWIWFPRCRGTATSG